MIRLVDSGRSKQTLFEQLSSIAGISSNVLLDAQGVVFTSMLIGELVNFAKELKAMWAGKPHSIAMTNINPSSMSMLLTVKFDRVIPLFESHDEAMIWIFDNGKTGQVSAV